MTITKATLLAVAENKSKIYGSSNPALTILYEGFVNGDDESVLDLAPTVSTQVNEYNGIGEYPISITPGLDNNYDVQTQEGKLTVLAAMLNVTIGDAERTYGKINPTFTIEYDGFVLGENESVFNPQPKAITTADQSSDVGQYSTTLDVSQGGNYEFEISEGVLIIIKASLLAIADDKTRPYAEENPELTITYQGFLNGDSESDLDEKPQLSTIAQVSSVVGMYEISITGGSDNNYEIQVEAGTFTIEKADQVISFEALEDVTINTGTVNLVATASSGLPVTFSSGDETLATISGNTVTLVNIGEVTITAGQEGNSNYNPAETVARTLNITEITALDDDIISVSIYPNPAQHYFMLNTTVKPASDIQLITQEGKMIRQFEYQEQA